MQLRDLQLLAERKGYEIVKQYCDEGQSGTKDSRPALNQMLADARKGKFRVLLVWRLDRLGRSLAHLLRLLEDFRAQGVELVSYSEGLDFTTTTGKLLYQLLAAFGEFERNVIAERVASGLRAAKARGVRLGRPRIPVDAAQIASLRAQGGSWAMITARTGISKGTAQRAVRSLPTNLPEKAPVNALFVAPLSAVTACP
jgi:DNA invertase Pin-like site-specific DNA recombinase